MPNDTRLPSIASALLILLHLLFVKHAFAITSEARDPVRGVTFYSTQISSDEKASIQMPGALFSASDVMTLGLSAFFFDESESVDQYVLWIRHDGPRRWFIGDIERPLEINLRDKTIAPSPFHRSRFTNSTDIPVFVEKLEFTLEPAELREVAVSDSVAIEVRTLLGMIVKELSASEIEKIRQFSSDVRERHNAIRSESASQSGAHQNL